MKSSKIVECLNILLIVIMLRMFHTLAANEWLNPTLAVIYLLPFFFNFFIINTLPIFNRLLVKPISFFFIVNESSVVWWGKYRN